MSSSCEPMTRNKAIAAARKVIRDVAVRDMSPTELSGLKKQMVADFEGAADNKAYSEQIAASRNLTKEQKAALITSHYAATSHGQSGSELLGKISEFFPDFSGAHQAMAYPSRMNKALGNECLDALLEQYRIPTLQDGPDAIPPDRTGENGGGDDSGIHLGDSLPSGGQVALGGVLSGMTLGGWFGLPGVLSSISGQASKLLSPIVVDLDGDGVEVATTQAFFDHDDNRFDEATNWVSRDDGLLVRDLDGDGRITSGRELFGDNTRLASGQLASDGYSAMADLDDNHDGKIDAADAAFSSLKIWRDADGDGVTDQGELLSLEEAGIASLGVQASGIEQTDAMGNLHKSGSSFTRTDGSLGSTVDIWFKTDPERSQWRDAIELSDEVIDLPDITGIGLVADLSQVMMADTSGALLGMVENFVSETSPSARRALVENIVLAWAGVADIPPTSRGANVDARHLVAIERFTAGDFLQRGSEPDPRPMAGAESEIKLAA